MPSLLTLPDVEAALGAAKQFLLAERVSGGNRISGHRVLGHWEGKLSTSALSTATAISALEQVRQCGTTGGLRFDQVFSNSAAAASAHGKFKNVPDLLSHTIRRASDWLVRQQNADGGFGDTDRSHSNIATTYLVRAALKMTGLEQEHSGAAKRAAAYTTEQGDWEGLRRRYGKDKTFVVPIMSNCALAGMIDWREIPRLPFEAAWLPQSWYRLAKMPVVSYAIPALVAIGQAQHFHAPTANPLLRQLRNAARRPTLKVLAKMQPASGGYLEATPLTSFVLMNLASMGLAHTPVAVHCLRFLLDSMLTYCPAIDSVVDEATSPELTGFVASSTTNRIENREVIARQSLTTDNRELTVGTRHVPPHEDGSWPIDTNLATWVTGLSLVALGREDRLTVELPSESKSPIARSGSQQNVPHRVVRWLLDCQHTRTHPFTGAQPGGWGWTDLSGAVPDADDTPGAILALQSLDLEGPKWSRLRQEVNEAIGGGLRWLCDLQNRDGGMPTFCKGWGQLPFDRSGVDLTAHALRAVASSLPSYPQIAATNPRTPSQERLERLITRGRDYIEQRQRADGSWLPLWFGNQDEPDEENPIYGTSKVLVAYAELGWGTSQPAVAAVQYLAAAQNPDGGWGGGPSVAYPQTGVPGSAGQEDQASAEAGSSTIEETALAVEALALLEIQAGRRPLGKPSIMRGVSWLAKHARPECFEHSWPIGFYFAKLWYHERLYPSIFSVAALATVARGEKIC